MFVDNSTENQTMNNVTKSLTDYTTKTTAFIDPAWQLAITIEFYFRYAVIAIGIFGTAANALVLYALIAHNAREAKKRAVNLLIVHQNVIDLSSCVLTVITFSIGHRKDLTGALGYFICTIFISEGASNSSLYAGVMNLVILTLERYLKVVHPFWSKKYIKRWMIYTGMVFAWISGIMSALVVVFPTTVVMDGYCLPFFIWESPAVRMIYGAITVGFFFVLPLIVFIYGYGHIVVVMRRQMRVMAGHNAQTNASQIQSKRVKWNIVKTMIIVSAAFIICWFPFNIYFMIVDNTAQASTGLYVGYYPTMFLAYVNICMNPFIYATKHEGVKEKLARLMMCHKCKRQAEVGNSAGTGRSSNTGRTKQTPPVVAHP